MLLKEVEGFGARHAWWASRHPKPGHVFWGSKTREGGTKGVAWETWESRGSRSTHGHSSWAEVGRPYGEGEPIMAALAMIGSKCGGGRPAIPAIEYGGIPGLSRLGCMYPKVWGPGGGPRVSIVGFTPCSSSFTSRFTSSFSLNSALTLMRLGVPPRLPPLGSRFLKSSACFSFLDTFSSLIIFRPENLPWSRSS